MSNADLIRKFYESFAKADAEGMISCYHPEIVFKDPAFGTLQGEDARNMWRMLIGRSAGQLKISFSDVTADERSGSAKWTAVYPFAKTGRKVFNKISAGFEFRDEKIIRHDDDFDLWRWSRQALGWKGYLLGWTPFMKAGIRRQALGLLKKYSSPGKQTTRFR